MLFNYTFMNLSETFRVYLPNPPPWLKVCDEAPALAADPDAPKPPPPYGLKPPPYFLNKNFNKSNSTRPQVILPG